MAAIVIDLNLTLVDARFAGDDLLDEVRIAVGESLYGTADLGLDQAAHLQHPGAESLQVCVELLGKVLAAHIVSSGQPKRPVM
jgi:hypothetical protein